MSDLKSKMPDLKEVTSIAGKFYKDMKTSVCEIIDDYKKKREEHAEVKKEEEKPKKPAAAKKDK